MSVLEYFNQDPDKYQGSFEPVVVQYPTRNGKAIIELGLVKNNDRLCFIVGKRLQSDGPLLILDQVNLSLVSQNMFSLRPKHWHNNALYSREFIRQAFEHFLNTSPFAGFIKANINPVAATQLLADLRALSPKLISFMSGYNHEQGNSDNKLSNTRSRTWGACTPSSIKCGECSRYDGVAV